MQGFLERARILQQLIPAVTCLSAVTLQNAPLALAVVCISINVSIGFLRRLKAAMARNSLTYAAEVVALL